MVPGAAAGHGRQPGGWERMEGSARSSALPARGREELRADGRVKIGQSCAERLLQGRGVKCLFSHFVLCLGEEPRSACALLAFPAGTRQAKASSGF